MKVLGIESSCDETSAAVVENGQRLLSNVVHSQIDIHAEYGGVVPEVAARSHIEMINPVINRALKEADCTWDDIDAIAVTYAPGLVGSLLIGSLAARTLAILHGKPLYAIHHIEAHVYANFITEQSNAARSRPGVDTSGKAAKKKLLRAEAVERTTDADNLSTLRLPSKQPKFPILALIVSGGHTQLMLFTDHGQHRILGQTQDDAVGEAFDKVAKIIGLPYPGGPAIAKAALSGDPHKFQLPKSKMQNKYDFSFSGLKTAVLRAIQREVGVNFSFPSHQLPERVTGALQADMAASFQHIAVETLVDKTKAAFEEFSPASVVIAGGVAANQELRHQLKNALPIEIDYAPIQLCTDNAAMVASLGYFQSQIEPAADPFKLKVVPSLTLQPKTTDVV